MKSVKKVAAKTPDSTTTPITMGFGACTAGQHERDGAGDGGEAGHDDGAETGLRGFDDGARELPAFVAELIGEFDDKDAVLGGQADQHDEADLR